MRGYIVATPDGQHLPICRECDEHRGPIYHPATGREYCQYSRGLHRIRLCGHPHHPESLAEKADLARRINEAFAREPLDEHYL